MITWSSTRLAVFESCKLKYDLTYNKGLYAEDTAQALVTRKGNAFHEFAEQYDPKWTATEALTASQELEIKYGLPEEFSLAQPVTRFVDLYQKVIQPVIAAGGTLEREIKFAFNLNGEPFVAKLDILLKTVDNRFVIIDHKTKKSTDTKMYASQMLLYVWALHLRHGIPFESLINNIDVQIFLPFASPKELSVQKLLKTIKFTTEDILAARDSRLAIIAATREPWDAEATLSKVCEFCPFAGMKAHCSLSASAGMTPTRGLAIKTRPWAST